MKQNTLRRKQQTKYFLMSVCSILVFLLVWQLSTDVFHLFTPTTLPSPVTVFQSLITKFSSTKPDGATLQAHTLASMQVALSGYFIGVVIGVPLGIAMAWFKPVDYFVTPLFDLLRPVPGIAWLPVMIVLFGIGLMSKAMVIFLSAFIACVINSYSGIKNTKPVHLWVGQTFGASNLQLLFKIAIPTAMPMIFTGLKVALGASWNALIAAELLASTRGLGFMINQARGIYRPDIILVGMIAVGVTGALLGWVIERLQRIFIKER